MAEPNNPQPDTGTGSTDEAKPAASGSKLFLIVLLLAILLPGGAGVYLTYSNYERVAAAAMAAGINIGTEDAEEQHEPTEYGQFMQLTDMVVNPSGSSGKRYLLVSLGLESQDPLTLEEITTKEVVVRDTILKVLGLQTVDELSDINRRSELKQELRDAVNAVLHGGQVDRMYFTQFVLQ